MTLQSIHPTRVYRQVATQLTALIEAGEYRVGERLPAERDLCVQLGVSRPSLREALIALEIEKIVEIRSGSGIYVLPPSPRPFPDLSQSTPFGPFDVIHARLHLESEIAVQASKNATIEQIDEISRCLEIMRLCKVGEPSLVDADRNFHISIAEASGNPAYVMLLDVLWQHRTTPLYYKLENHFFSTSVWNKAMQEHEAIFQAIVTRDQVAALNAMKIHLTNAENRLASKL